MSKSYTVQQLANLAGVTVRTLHYYDQIGLLRPSKVAHNGYRYYEEKELMILQQILFFRELEFPLDKIKQILSNPDFDYSSALSEHKKMLLLKRKRIENLLITIDRTLQSLKGGEKMNDTTLFDPFKQPEYLEHRDEVEKRWGNTDAYKQSMERMKKWTKEDYEKIKRDGDEITRSIVRNMSKGPHSDEVQHDIYRYFTYMQQFYDCSPEMFRMLGNMYVEDSRFTATYEKYAKGLALFMRDAMNYFADKQR